MSFYGREITKKLETIYSGLFYESQETETRFNSINICPIYMFTEDVLLALINTIVLVFIAYGQILTLNKCFILYLNYLFISNLVTLTTTE
ncbi:MAG: hypothetical protein ACFFE4_08905 [Candidatus Thorarchaeota archaeon]